MSYTNDEQLGRNDPQRNAIKAAAADWMMRIMAPGCPDAVRAEFEDWYHADNRHSLAYEQCKVLWLMSKHLEQDPEITQALQQSRHSSARSHITHRQKPRMWSGLAAAACLLLVGLTVLLNPASTPEVKYVTRVGEQHLIQLPDGSSALLNTDSEIRVSFSRARRSIQLVKGEAYFTVSKDPSRPFEVTADKRLVRAVGTQFNVALLNRILSVDVTEGVVELETATKNNPTPHVITRIKLGEAVHMKEGQDNATLDAADVARIQAWQARKIHFANDTLEDAVKEYNRYAKEPVVIVDKELKQQRISGIFNMGDTETFIFSLEQGLGVRIEQQQGQWQVFKK